MTTNSLVGKLAAAFATALIATHGMPAHARPGDLDPAFSFDGKVTTDFGGADSARGVASALVGGKIVAAGHAGGPTDFAVARYLADGTLDTSFGGNGKVTTEFFTNDVSQANSIATLLVFPGGIGIDPVIATIAAGGVHNTSEIDSDFALARYRSDGSLETSFGGDGLVMTDLNGNDVIQRVAFQTVSVTHRVIAAGNTDRDGTGDFVLARYNLNGALDTSFGSSGIVITDVDGNTDFCNALAIQSDSKILAGGLATISGSTAFAILRYNANGSPDASFGSSGKVVVAFPGVAVASFCTDLVIQANGKILAVGKTFLAAGPNLLARLNTDGSLDATFGSGGRVVTSASAALLNPVSSVRVQPDGKILVAGGCPDISGTGTDFGVVRYAGNGALDKSFGNGGRARVDFGLNFASASGLLLQGDGNIVVAGGVSTNNSDFAIARLKTAQGDARAGLKPNVPRGNDIINLTGAQQTQNVAIPHGGGVRNVVVGIQNDTAASDSFAVRGTPGNTQFRVKYLRGSTNVTGQVLAGTLTTGTLAPGAIFKLKAQITATTPLTGKARTFSIIPTSAADPTAKDRVIIKARSN